MSLIDFGRAASLRTVMGVAATLGVALPAAAAPTVSVELNRLEPRETACRVSLVIKNEAEKALDSLKLDLVFFDKQGVIARRLAVEAGPLRATKTSVKLFEATDLGCDAVGRVLLNDVTACSGEADCLGLIATSSKVKDVEFGK